MPSGLKGGCLCGQTRYDTASPPLWVTICHCHFCQHATGADRMIQPVFEKDGFRFSGVAPACYAQKSQGSGKAINIHFCAACGTKLALSFERWPDKIGLYIGTLDNPALVRITAQNSKHIFTSEARPGTILPPGVPTYLRHAAEPDGTVIAPILHSAPFVT